MGDMARRANPKPTRYVARNGEVSWRVRYRIGKGADATQTSETFTTRADAHAFCDDMALDGVPAALRRLQARTNPDTGAAPRLDAVLDEFLAWTARNVRSTRTVEDYRRDYTKAIRPTFGSSRVDEITDDQVQAWVDAMAAGTVAARVVGKGPDAHTQPLHPKTIGDRHGLLSSILDFAARPPRKYMPANPCAHTRLPHARKRPPDAVKPGEWDALHRALEQISPDAADLALALYSTGARFSEVTALTTHDVEDRGGDRVVLNIANVIRREAGSKLVRVADTKSAAGFRRVKVGRQASAMIRRRLATATPGGFLFTTQRGHMWRHGNFRTRAWVPACELANLSPLPKIHGLRHLHVAELVWAGVPLSQIRVRLGHESITTTLNTYGMLAEEVEGDVLDRLEDRATGPAVGSGAVIRGELGD